MAMNMMNSFGGAGAYGAFDWDADEDEKDDMSGVGGTAKKEAGNDVSIDIQDAMESKKNKNPFGSSFTSNSKKNDTNNETEQNPFDLNDDSHWQDDEIGKDSEEFTHVYDELNSMIDEIETNIRRVKSLHQRFAATANASDEADLMKELDTIMSDNGQVQKRVKDRIKSAKEENDSFENDNRGSSVAQWRKNQLNTCTRRFKKSSTDFQNTLNEFNKYLRNRQTRLIETVDIEHKLTAEDREKMADEPDKARKFIQQSFQMEDISDEMLTRLEELEARHDGMQRIADSMQELQEMWQELHMLILDQGELIESIAHNVEMTRDYVKSAGENLVKAEKHQKAARKYRLYLLGLCLCLMVVALIATGAGGGFSSG